MTRCSFVTSHLNTDLNIRFTIFLINFGINLSYYRHIEIQLNTGIENHTSSIIFFDSVTALDGGIYTCEVNQMSSMSILFINALKIKSLLFSLISFI